MRKIRQNNCPDKGCYCDCTTFPPCPYCMMHGVTEWSKLSKDEQAIMLTYKFLLKSDEKIPGKIIMESNNIFEKYQNLSVLDIP